MSSQFLSGLLMALPASKDVTTVEVEGPLVSQPYLAMTLAVMEAFGVRIGNHKFRRFNVQPSSYYGRPYEIEPDASAASYFFAAAAVTGGRDRRRGPRCAEPPGRHGVRGRAGAHGLHRHQGQDATTVKGGPLRGVDVDMNAISDTVMTLAVVALFAQGITRIRNVAHIRHKETDRIGAVAAELRKLGATVDEHPDGLVIIPPTTVKPARIATYDDHRMAMAFAVAGLSGAWDHDPRPRLRGEDVSGLLGRLGEDELTTGTRRKTTRLEFPASPP